MTAPWSGLAPIMNFIVSLDIWPVSPFVTGFDWAPQSIHRDRSRHHHSCRFSRGTPRELNALALGDLKDKEGRSRERHVLAALHYSTGCYVVIPPNESRREKLQRMANQELEEWERFKEARRLGPVNITPGKVGGYLPETETRQRQQMVQSQSRYQKMLQKEEYKKKQKAEEDAQIQKMKDIQRQKAEKLELKKRQEEQSRQNQWQEDMFLRNHAFLDQLSPGENNYRTNNRCETEPSVSTRRESYKQQSKQEEERKLQDMKEEQRRKSELLELKQRQEEEQRRTSQQDHHRRVNNAFLDRLERKNTSNPNQDRYYGLRNAWN
ncbi:Hypothetical predicted protein [Pelobates cultripes]|uniref:Epithelial stromal interaction 1 n=1 Tax=Pelobates cultripes TaxID=61616 RepID=A0AAD1R5U2_PELCU|nr:Hypothetical predicted protein [Pelobates cultripes]